MFNLFQRSFGGGGHHTVAGVQLTGLTIEEAKDKLEEKIEDYFEENLVQFTKEESIARHVRQVSLDSYALYVAGGTCRAVTTQDEGYFANERRKV